MNTNKILLICAAAAVLSSCTTADERIPSLYESYSNYFPIGVSVGRSELRSVTDTTFIIKHFNSLTPSEMMQPDKIHPRADRWRWRLPDELVDFAERNNKQVRGYCLLQYDKMPDWMYFDGERVTSRDSLYSRIKQHITTIMKRYQGKIKCWDVVSCAVADDTSLILRQNTWMHQIAGDDYVEYAFRCAHEADSTALLFYSDYNLNRPDKLERTCKLIKSLKDKGVHIDGVGMHGHWSIYEPTVAQLDTAISRFRALGLQVHITQLDVSFYKWERFRNRRLRPNETVIISDSIKTVQAQQYTNIFQTLRRNADVVKSVTFWGIDDRHSWLNNYPVRGRRNYPLLFDSYRTPKQVFYQICEDALSNSNAEQTNN